MFIYSILIRYIYHLDILHIVKVMQIYQQNMSKIIYKFVQVSI
jgi:hypothetical protein